MGLLAQIGRQMQLLQYSVSPDDAVAFVKLLIASRDRELSESARDQLARLRGPALAAIVRHAKGVAPDEEEGIRLARGDLVRLFDAVKPSLPPFEAVRRCLEAHLRRYAGHFERPHWESLSRYRTPKQRAMAVLEAVLPVGRKRIEQIVYRPR